MNKFKNFIKNFFQSRSDRYYRTRKWHLAADLFLLAVIIALIGWVGYIKFHKPAGVNLLDINIEAAQPVISGQANDYYIKYHNISSSNLKQVKLVFVWPENFILQSVSPVEFFDQRTNSFTVGDLDARANGEIKIKGIVLGNLGSQARFVFSANYFLPEVRSELFEKEFTIKKSSLDLDWKPMGIIYEQQTNNFDMTFSNQGEVNYKNIICHFSDKDIRLDSDLSSLIKDNQVHIGQIDQGKDKKVNFGWRYAGQQNSLDFSFECSAEANSRKLKIISENREVQIKKMPLLINIECQDSNISIGNMARYQVTIKNNSQEKLRKIKLFLLTDKNHAVSSLKIDAKPFISQQDDLIIIDSPLSPNDQVELSMKVGFVRKKITPNDYVNLKIKAEYEINGQKIATEQADGNLKVDSTYDFNAAVRYYSRYGDQLGVGPIPPVVGQPTKYWVFLNLDNIGNALTGFEFTANLPAGVIWSEEKSLSKGNLTFDQSENTINWQVDNIGQVEENCQAAFSLAIFPQKSDVGKNMTLLNNLKYKFIDSFTGQKVTGTIDKLDNRLNIGDKKDSSGKVIIGK